MRELLRTGAYVIGGPIAVGMFLGAAAVVVAIVFLDDLIGR